MKHNRQSYTAFTTKFKMLTLAGIAVLALVLASVNSYAQGVVGSQHDLSTGGNGQLSVGDDVCVFCHTPHGANVSFDGAPLWNKVVNATPETTYTRYSTLNTATFDAEETVVGSVSLACLSCHDGTQAMDSVINASGTGGWNAAGTNLGAGQLMASIPAGAPIPNLGTDLSDDHPISMQYAGGGVDTTTHTTEGLFAGTLTDPDFVAPTLQTINGQPQWFVDGDANGIRNKTDMILYTRDFTTSATTGPSVECGSCHDPHNSSTGDLTNQVAFLRVSNAQSAVCTACHNK